MNGSLSHAGQVNQVFGLELRKKDDEIVQLKIEVGHLREKLREVDVTNNLCEKCGETPTPIKSNRSKQRTIQSSNEEDDLNARMVHRLESDLKNEISAEETLKRMLREKTSELNSVSQRADNLAQENSDLLAQVKEVSNLKRELKMVTKEKIKMKKSLAEAVNMLNALQEHVLTAEKERKKIKKQLRAVVNSGNLNSSADGKSQC